MIIVIADEQATCAALPDCCSCAAAFGSCLCEPRIESACACFGHLGRQDVVQRFVVIVQDCAWQHQARSSCPAQLLLACFSPTRDLASVSLMPTVVQGLPNRFFIGQAC